MMTSRARLLLVLGLLALATGPAWGVRPKAWTIDEPADYLAGTLQDVSLSSRAELRLAPPSQRYELDSKEADTVNTLVVGPDGMPYLGTGPNGIVYRLREHVPQKFVDVPGGQVFSLLFLHDGSLLVGTGGRQGAIYRVQPDGTKKVFWQSPSVRYIWSMVREPGGTVYAATGTAGEIYRISADGQESAAIVSLPSTKNILTMTLAGHNRLVFGTDGNGLVGQVNTQTGKMRILLDAGERSVSSLASLPDGTVYVATTRGAEKSAGGPGPAPTRPQGRPESDGDTGPDGIAATTTASASPGNATMPSGRGDRGGPNMIYRVDANGQASEILSLPALPLSMTATDNRLVVGTGSPGRVYLVQPESERYSALVREDAAYFSAAGRAAASQGAPGTTAPQTSPAAESSATWVGTSRPAAVVRIQPGFSREGTYTSTPQDAGQAALWGRVAADMTLPAGTSVTLQTRSSNLRDPSGPGWSGWSEPILLDEQADTQIASPPGRFLQFRLVLKADRSGGETPVVRSVKFPYLVQNLGPEISALSVNLPESAAAKRGDDVFSADSTLPIEWQARDPNGDTLSFEVYLRQVGNKRWIRIAKDIRKNSFTWDSRSVPDGRYEVRVVGSDLPDNPPGMAITKARISDPFMADNTPPRIESIRSSAVGQNTFRIQVRLADASSDLAAAQYSLDAADAWTSLLPADEILDSLTESLDFTVGPLPAGEHIVTLRAADTRGNTAHAWLTLTVE